MSESKESDLFRVGDLVKRKNPSYGGSPRYSKEEPFVISAIKQDKVDKYAMDSNGALHSFSNLALVKVADRVKPAAVTGEVRSVSITGGEKGVKPESYALVPWEAMDEIARVYEFGSKKYAAHNWRRGYEWSKSFSALCRHIFAFWRGEDKDPESGLSHLAHAGFHILGMLTFVLDREKYGNFDDRYKQDS